MCAIFGFVGNVRRDQWASTHSLLHELMSASVMRGRDAAGFAALTDPVRASGRRRLVVEKRPVPADTYAATSIPWRTLPRCGVVLGHARYATSGTPNHEENNHPHVSRDRRYALVHNGHLPGHRATAHRMRLDLRSECDSELLVRVVERDGDAAVGLDRCLRESLGSMAVAVLDVREGRVYLARNDARPLWLCRLRDRRWFFASTDGLLARSLVVVLGQRWERSVDVMMPLSAGVVVSLSTDGTLTACTPLRSEKRLTPRGRRHL